jgi:hypothetical protein
MLARISLGIAAFLLANSLARADVRLVEGSTPIPGGDALDAGDLTVVNDKLAFALAAGTPVPYGVPRGAIVDIAPVSEGKIGRDRVVFADFIPDNWSAWPNTYRRIEVVDKGPKQVILHTLRDFGRIVIETLYVLRDGSDEVEIQTTMTNAGSTEIDGLLSGLTLWPSSGYLFAVPGMAGVKEADAQAALAHRVTAYDRDWAITLHAPYFDHVGSGSRDLFLSHSLKAGESRSFTGWLQAGARGDLAPVVKAQIDQAKLPFGAIHGSVAASDRAPVADALVMVEKAGQPYAWALAQNGAYRLDLPVGDYALYATGRNYSRTAPVTVSVAAGSDTAEDFTGLEPPGRVEFSIADARHTPLDARILITEGERPTVEFLGRTTFFTELDRKGRISIPVAPGKYTFAISAGNEVLAQDARTSVTVKSGEASPVAVAIRKLFDPPARGWYSADLHHHCDQAEAVTPPEDLARSELAAGLDFLFVSDHDTTINHPTLEQLARRRGVPFIPGIELSPSWGHFNAYPLSAGAKLAIDTGTSPVDAIFKEARREGATIVQVNHPFIPYGYFSSVAKGVAPGGFDKGFDLMEINSANSGDDAKVLAKLADYWNAGERHYLTAGSDTHDVWNEQSGKVRAYVHLEGPPTVAGFASGLKSGHAYVTYGPLIFPSVMFGTELSAAKSRVVTFDLASVAGLRRVEFVQGGQTESRTFGNAPTEARVEFKIGSNAKWCAVRVEDSAGRKAYSNPIWLSR